MPFAEVLVFVQQGCPACHEVQPIVDKLSQQYRLCVGTRIVDANKEGLLSDVMRVQETPTLIGYVNNTPTVRLIGANDFEPRADALYKALMQGSSCEWKGDV